MRAHQNVFSATFRMNMKEERRMRKEAMELLDMTNLKTYEIASRLGYQSVQYFSTLFKNRTGVTPQEYKKRRAGENAEI